MVSHYWNTKANLDYVGPIPDIKYFGADETSEGDRKDFLSWCNEQKRQSLTTAAFWNSISKMMSPSCDRPVRYSGAILQRLEISRFSSRQ